MPRGRSQGRGVICSRCAFCRGATCSAVGRSVAVPRVHSQSRGVLRRAAGSFAVPRGRSQGRGVIRSRCAVCRGVTRSAVGRSLAVPQGHSQSRGILRRAVGSFAVPRGRSPCRGVTRNARGSIASMHMAVHTSHRRIGRGVTRSHCAVCRGVTRSAVGRSFAVPRDHTQGRGNLHRAEGSFAVPRGCSQGRGDTRSAGGSLAVPRSGIMATVGPTQWSSSC